MCLKQKQTFQVCLVENHSSVGLTTYLLVVFLLILGLGPYRLLKSLLIEKSQGQLSLGRVPIDI